MSPAPLNRPTRKSRPAAIAGANRRQAARRAAGMCLLSKTHGAAWRAGRCRSCYERMDAGRKRYDEQHREQNRLRARIRHGYKRWLIAKAEAKQRILARIRWAAEDRREELIALGEITALHKVS